MEQLYATTLILFVLFLAAGTFSIITFRKARGQEQQKHQAHQDNWILQQKLQHIEKQLADSQLQLTHEVEQVSQLQQSNKNLDVELGKVEARLVAAQEKQMDQQELLARAEQTEKELRNQLGQYQEQIVGLKELLEKLRAERDGAVNQVAEIKADRDGLKKELDELHRQYVELNREHARLQSQQTEREQSVESQLKLLQDNKEELSKAFENLANRIFEVRGKAFADTSQQSLETLLKPFREQITESKAKVEDIHHKELQQQVTLVSELKHLKELNQKITTEAHELSTALKGQKKMQGNWGELVLENVLDRSGLRLNQDYRREVSFNTEDGRRRPDAIVYLPQSKHLIIDAKVSLNAYTAFVNAEDEVERQRALKDHVTAMSQRIEELSARNYFDLPGMNSPEMVFMFVPIESAFVEAFKADETLFQKALEHNVLVATPTTLLTSLNIVRQLWRFEEQNCHTAELADKAVKVYDKLRTFLGSMEAVGKQLDRAQQSYKTACDQLTNGRGNLIKQALEFKELGVSVKAELPAEFVARAELELPQVPFESGSDDSHEAVA